MVPRGVYVSVSLTLIAPADEFAPIEIAPNSPIICALCPIAIAPSRTDAVAFVPIAIVLSALSTIGILLDIIVVPFGYVRFVFVFAFSPIAILLFSATAPLAPLAFN